ncbi:hypothetical protein GCM10022393_21790 [Aquimarina addita]|uniref:Uncharacterized protein n=1 Tax=Aquimarina addita TaxID=870485 RepID=A0ABP6ULL2_9FLAO
MNFYNFRINAFQWKAILERNQMRKVFVPIDNNEWVKEENYPVKMDLVDSYQDLSQWKGDTPFKDVINWSSDFTIGGLTHKAGAFMIMTQKVKEILEKYNLPPHRFYPTELFCKHYKETRKDYFVFHMIGKGVYGDEYIDYLKCTFIESKRDVDYKKISIKTHPEGIIKSLDSYNNIAFGKNSFLGTYEEKLGSGEIKIKRNDLDFLNKVYKHDYDVLWGLPNLLYISEEIKQELENVGITNGNFFKVKENMIRAFEYNKSNS